MPASLGDSVGVTRHPLFNGTVKRKLQAVPPDEPLIRLLETSFTQCAAGGLASRFYERLFARHSELRRLFPVALAEQSCKLDRTLRDIVASLRSPELLRGKLEDLGRRHASLGLTPVHYEWVIDALIETMAGAAGTYWNDELAFEWGATLRLVAETMMRGAADAPSHFNSRSVAG